MDLKIWELFLNKPLVSAGIAQVSSQIFKIFLPLFRGKRPNIKKLTHYGDIPSAHTAFIVALSFSIAFNEGWASPLFAICAVVSSIIIYDILKLRTAVEISLKVSKKIIEKENIQMKQKIPQFKGHSSLEVITGIIWGFVVAVICQLTLPF